MYEISSTVKNYVMLVLIGVLLVLGGCDYVKVKSLKSDLATEKAAGVVLTSNLKECKVANDEFVKTSKDQNTAVETLQHEAAQRAKASVEAVKVANAKAEAWKSRYGRILSEPAPPGVPLCVAAEAHIDSYLKLRMDTSI